MPSYNIRNEHVTKAQYPEMMNEARNFMRSLLKSRIAVYNDCPIPPCYAQIDEKDKAKPGYIGGIRYGNCTSVYDVYPDYVIEGCMGVGSRVHFDLKSCSSISEIDCKYNQKMIELHGSHECGSCKRCHGGCYGFTEKT